MMKRGAGGDTVPYHAQRLREVQLRCAAACCALGAAVAVADEGAGAVLHDTIIARAEEAWQSDAGDAMYFRGGLELRGSKWRIMADRARIEGKLADPGLVVVEGDPARIVVSGGKDGEPFEGHSRHLEFEPGTETVRLAGGARIVKGRQSISSESIEYLLARDVFAAGSHGRVRVVTTPD
jgi:lipopolysaccharide transport protein LptA